MRRPRRAGWLLPVVAVSVLLTPVAAGASGQPTSGAAQNLRSLQSQRDKVRSQKAQKASSVNALKASDGQITAALSALGNQVDSQTQELENAQRGVQQAEADATAAAQAEADAGSRLTSLRNSMREQAISAYINVPGEQDWSLLSDDDPTVAMSRRTLMEFQTGRNLDAAEEFRSLQEDLGLARQAKESAKARAQSHQSDVKSHLDQLAAAQAKQQQFQDQVESRMDQALSEADALAGIDANLSGQITARQTAIAKQLAAQARANQVARAALTSSGRAPKSGGSPSRSGGSVPAIVSVGSSHIVSVGGIQVDQSIASNLAALAERGIGGRHQLRWGRLSRSLRADRRAAQQLRHEPVRDLRDAGVVLPPADSAARFVDARTWPRHRLHHRRQHDLAWFARLQLAEGERRSLRLLQPAVRAVALVGERQLYAGERQAANAAARPSSARERRRCDRRRAPVAG